MKSAARIITNDGLLCAASVTLNRPFLNQPAQTLSRSQSALGAFYRRMKARLGGPKAITATAHKIARIFFHIWSKGDAYVDPGVDADEQKYQERLLNHLQRKAQSLGFDLVPKPDGAEYVS